MIDHQSSIPLYQQIADTLKGNIHIGVYRESGLAFFGYLAALAAGGGENGAGMRISLFIQKE